MEEKKKDFLEQFSSDDKPKSFQEETLIPIKKEPLKINWKITFFGIFAGLVLLSGFWYFFLVAKIAMPNFVGQKQSEVIAWLKQEAINPQGVVFKKDYSLEVEKELVISQSITAGKKVKKDSKLTFVISDGANPDEPINFPNIRAMKKAEIEAWIKENKLLNTRIKSLYSNTVPSGEVIDYEYRGEESEFKRGNSLTIKVSKGVEPTKKITVEDFSGKSEQDILAWADKNKIRIAKEEQYHSSKTAGSIISTSPGAGQSINQGDILKIYISKGKGISVPNFLSMSKTQFEVYKQTHKNYNIKEDTGAYSNSSNYILSQSPKAGSVVGEGEGISVTTNMGNHFYLENEKLSLVGNYYNKLVDDLNTLRQRGIDAYAGSWSSGTEIYSDKYSKGQIISVKCSGYSDNKLYSCNGPLPLDVRFDVLVSKGLTWKLKTENSTINELMSALTSGSISAPLQLDKDIKAQDYDLPGQLFDKSANRKVMENEDIYEDHEYIIKKA